MLKWFRKKKSNLIDYERFAEMNLRLGIDPDDEDVIKEVLREFYLNDKRDFRLCLEEFEELITREVNYDLKLRLDFENKPASYFLTANVYENQSNLVALYNHLSGSNKQAISLQMAKQVRLEFLQSVSHFRELYEWIYNPPATGKVSKWSIGQDMRRDFSEHYGAYAEITYLISSLWHKEFDEVEKMKLSEYLSVGEYLLRKRIVESIE